jgi:hypothetical protein
MVSLKEKFALFLLRLPLLLQHTKALTILMTVLTQSSAYIQMTLKIF